MSQTTNRVFTIDDIFKEGFRTARCTVKSMVEEGLVQDFNDELRNAYRETPDGMKGFGVDLFDIDPMSSACIGTLIWINNEHQQRYKGPLSVIVSPHIKETLMTTRLDRLFACYGTCEDYQRG